PKWIRPRRRSGSCLRKIDWGLGLCAMLSPASAPLASGLDLLTAAQRQPPRRPVKKRLTRRTARSIDERRPDLAAHATRPGRRWRESRLLCTLAVALPGPGHSRRTGVATL